jgi:hypothetical protein
MMPSDLEPLEVAVLDKLLSGAHPVLTMLRAQLVGAAVKSRELTGVGFFTEFALAPDAVPAPVRTLRFGDVQATVTGLNHGAGFLIFVDGGLLKMLEGYAYGEPWPDRIQDFSVRYMEPGRPHLAEELRDTGLKLRDGR